MSDVQQESEVIGIRTKTEHKEQVSANPPIKRSSSSCKSTRAQKRSSSSLSSSRCSSSSSAMKDEISAASDFLTRLISRQNDHLSESQVQQFRQQLDCVLHRKFANHWFPDKPSRGQAFRCIRVNENIRRDSILETVCQEIGLPFTDLIMPTELTLWIDPEEVTCRFGEHKGSYCLVAQFKDGNKENYADQINVDELEQMSLLRNKQASFDLVNTRKRNQARINAARSLQMTQMYNETYGMQMTQNPAAVTVPVMTSASYFSPVTGYYTTGKYTSSYSPSGSSAAAAAAIMTQQQQQQSSPYSQSVSYSVSPTNGRPTFRSTTGYTSSPSFANNNGSPASAAAVGSGKFGTSARGLGSAFNSASAAAAANSGTAAAASATGTSASTTSAANGYGQQGDRFHYVKSSLKA